MRAILLVLVFAANACGQIEEVSRDSHWSISLVDRRTDALGDVRTSTARATVEEDGMHMILSGNINPLLDGWGQPEVTASYQSATLLPFKIIAESGITAGPSDPVTSTFRADFTMAEQTKVIWRAFLTRADDEQVDFWMTGPGGGTYIIPDQRSWRGGSLSEGWRAVVLPAGDYSMRLDLSGLGPGANATALVQMAAVDLPEPSSVIMLVAALVAGTAGYGFRTWSRCRMAGRQGFRRT